MDIIRSYLRELTLYSIHHNQRLVVACERGTATDIKFHVISTRSTRSLGSYQTRHFTGKGLGNVSGRAVEQLLVGNLGNGTYHALFLLVAITYDHYFLNGLRVIKQHDVQLALRAHTDVL